MFDIWGWSQNSFRDMANNIKTKLDLCRHRPLGLRLVIVL